jgi:acetoin utilization protein AcuB
MQVREIMTTPVTSVDADDPLIKALELMRSGGFRRLPVLHQGQLVGVVTDRDLRLATNSPLVLSEKWYSEFILESIKVKACMTADPITIVPDASVLAAAHLMRQKKIGGLPVVEDGTVVGIVTVTDLLDALIQRLEQEEGTA